MARVPCKRCGSDAEMGFSNPKLGIEPANYCFECFEIEYPDFVEEMKAGYKVAMDHAENRRN